MAVSCEATLTRILIPAVFVSLDKNERLKAIVFLPESL